MIILDTNVVSEAMKPNPDSAVIAWFDSQMVDDLFLTVTSLAELLTGIEVLPIGKRRAVLVKILRESMERFFGPRILAFDQAEAVAYATIFARARASGYTIAVGDGQIAAIATAHGYAVATRDTRPFLAAGVRVINPWQK